MNNLFRSDSLFMELIEKLGTLILLNLLWLACCVPVVTIGPAFTALYGYMRKIGDGNWPPVWDTYWRCFRQNFRQALVISLFLAVPAAVAAFYLLQVLLGDFAFGNASRFLMAVVVLVLSCFCSYAFPLLANFENTVWGTLKNAVLVPLVNPLISVAVALLNLLPLVILYFDAALLLRLGVFWLFLGTALTAFINAKLLNVVFQKMISKQ